MVQKFKSPEMAKEKGQALNIKLLKNILSEGFEEPRKFFYDTTFDFGSAGKLPFLFIGEKVPTPWKAYIKQNKLNNTFVAGKCITDEEGNLKLVIEIGKGGKPPMLKEINKNLLKPAKRKAYFVESIEAEESLEEVNVAENAVSTDLEEVDVQYLILELQDQTKDGKNIDEQFATIISDLEQPLSNIKDTIVTDELVEKVTVGTKILYKNKDNYNLFLGNANSLLKSFDQSLISNNPELKKEIDSLHKVMNDLSNKMPTLDMIKNNGAKVKLAENPMDTEFPPVSDEPFENFANNLSSKSKGSALNKYYNDLMSL